MPETLTYEFQANNHETLSRFRIGARHRDLRFHLLWSGQQRHSPQLLVS